MYWTLELATKLEDAPWPATKEELIDFAIRSGAPMEVAENLEKDTPKSDSGYERVDSIIDAMLTKDVVEPPEISKVKKML